MGECIFCKIAKGEIPAEKVYEDNDWLAINDISPQAPIHLIVIPKIHVNNILDSQAKAVDLNRMPEIALDLANKFGLTDKGIRIVHNCGDDGGQTVGHMHFHILGGRHMQWPPG